MMSIKKKFRLLFLFTLASIFNLQSFSQDAYKKINDEIKAIHFTGKLGNTAIEMTLKFTIKTDSFAVTGSYFYSKYKLPITLKGIFRKQSYPPLSLLELDKSGNIVARIEGEIQYIEDKDVFTFKGLWISYADNSKKYNINLVTDNILLWTKGIEQLNEFVIVEWNYMTYKSKCIEFYGKYPVIYSSNSKIKTEALSQPLSLFELFVENTNRDTCSLEYENWERTLGGSVYEYCREYSITSELNIVFDRFLIDKSFEEGDCGGPHFSEESYIHVTDIVTGVQLDLESIFDINKNYKEFLSETCKQGLKNCNDSYEMEQEKIKEEDIINASDFNGENYTRFTFTEEGLVIIFPYFTIGRSWVWRNDEVVEIKWKELEPYLSEWFKEIIMTQVQL